MSCVDINEKRPVIYSRTLIVSGYVSNDYADFHIEVNTVYDFRALELVLYELCPTISFLKYRDLLGKVHHNQDIDYEHYGSSKGYLIRWIPLQVVIEFIESYCK